MTFSFFSLRHIFANFYWYIPAWSKLMNILSHVLHSFQIFSWWNFLMKYLPSNMSIIFFILPYDFVIIAPSWSNDTKGWRHFDIIFWRHSFESENTAALLILQSCNHAYFFCVSTVTKQQISLNFEQKSNESLKLFSGVAKY